jgi:hypothetical protein
MVQLEPVRRIGSRTRRWRAGREQDLALVHVAQIFNLLLCVLTVDRNEGNAEARTDVPEDAGVALERTDLEVIDHGIEKISYHQERGANEQ